MENQAKKDLQTSISGIKGVHHIGISVADLAASLVFYERATTLTCQRLTGFSGTGLAATEAENTAVLKGPNSYIELMQFDPALQGNVKAIPVEGPGITHICFQSPAEHKMYNMFISQQAIPVTRGDGPIDLGGYGVHYAYLRNADQTMFEVEQLDNSPFEGPVWIGHVALVSHDIDRLVDFYSRIFGIEPYRRVNKVVGPRIEEVTDIDNVRVRAAWFNVGNMILEIWEYVNPVTPDTGAARSFESLGYNKYAFEVADIEREFIRLEALGVNFTGPVQKTPIGQEVYATDPDGNCFSLLEVDENDLSIDRLAEISWKTA
ncbi:MAG: catechol 2,3-dioxygenase-like lactoylglutathione lyase family enzyme [Alteromonas macleodii]|jgi:catechol 2,3-dioxygenase-like lactoylglutathione lyase family enzyme